MTLDEVRNRVEAVRAAAVDKDDWEQAHVLEDELYLAVLEAIAQGAADAPALAREARKANAISYDRWYA